MRDTFLVCCFQCIDNLAGDLHRLVKRNRTFFDPIRQRRSFDQLHHEIIWTNIVQVADMRMIEGCDHTRFALEALRETLGGNLDRDIPAEPRIASSMDFAHAALTDERNNLVWTELLAFRK